MSFGFDRPRHLKNVAPSERTFYTLISVFIILKFNNSTLLLTQYVKELPVRCRQDRRSIFSVPCEQVYFLFAKIPMYLSSCAGLLLISVSKYFNIIFLFCRYSWFLFLNILKLSFCLQISSVLRRDCDALHFSSLFCSLYGDGGGSGHDFVLFGPRSSRWDTFSLLWSSSTGNECFIDFHFIVLAYPVLRLYLVILALCTYAWEIYVLSISYNLFLYYRGYWQMICLTWTSSICCAKVTRTSLIVLAGSITHHSPTPWSLMFRSSSRIVVYHVGVMAGPEVLELEPVGTVSQPTDNQGFLKSANWNITWNIFITLSYI